MGGALSDDCGYKMLPIVPFSKVLKQVAKKSLCLLFLLFITSNSKTYAYNGFSDEFINKFQDCSIYGENSSLNNKGTVFNDMKFIAKNQDSSCHYQQTISSQYGTINLQCKFTPEQVKELYKTMQENNPPYVYSYKSENLWNKYVNDSSVCKTDITTIWEDHYVVPPEYLPWKLQNIDNK